jgi:hypothetical protein
VPVDSFREALRAREIKVIDQSRGGRR